MGAMAARTASALGRSRQSRSQVSGSRATRRSLLRCSQRTYDRPVRAAPPAGPRRARPGSRRRDRWPARCPRSCSVIAPVPVDRARHQRVAARADGRGRRGRRARRRAGHRGRCRSRCPSRAASRRGPRWRCCRWPRAGPAAAQLAEGGFEGVDADLEGGEHVGQALPARVVEMRGELDPVAEHAARLLEERAHLHRVGHPRGVAEADLLGAGAASCRGDGEHALGRDVALVGAAEGHRDDRFAAQALAAGVAEHALKADERLGGSSGSRSCGCASPTRTGRRRSPGSARG